VLLCSHAAAKVAALRAKHASDDAMLRSLADWIRSGDVRSDPDAAAEARASWVRE
jgi:hypothetical protein